MKSRHVVAQLDKSEDDDLDGILRQAARRYPSIPKVVEDRFVSRWREGLPLFPAGSLLRFRDFVALPPQRGVAFAGDNLCSGATRAAYQTGLWAAGDLLARL